MIFYNHKLAMMSGGDAVVAIPDVKQNVNNKRLSRFLRLVREYNAITLESCDGKVIQLLQARTNWTIYKYRQGNLTDEEYDYFCILNTF